MSARVMKPRSSALTVDETAEARCWSATCEAASDRLRIFLKVVRGEPLGFLGYELLEVGPVQLRVPERCLSLGVRETELAENRRPAQRGGDARTRQPRKNQRQRPHHEEKAVVGARCGAYARREDRSATPSARHIAVTGHILRQISSCDPCPAIAPPATRSAIPEDCWWLRKSRNECAS